MATLRRTEAKAFFANERTFLHWMNMSVTIGSISAALLGVAGHGHKHWGSDYTHRAVLVRVLALCMMAAAIGMAIYSAVYFKIRGEMLLNKLDGPYDNRLLPIVLSVIMITALSITFVSSLMSL
mmetsp:Transcript_19790/g.59789  ORF Transcript_19790/g.59789 Transcript_19790/m.59789 type:complete len:124 (-) Transcript_19790:1239-1610(-)